MFTKNKNQKCILLTDTGQNYLNSLISYYNSRGFNFSYSTLIEYLITNDYLEHRK